MKNLRMQQEMTDRGRLEIRVNTRIQARPVSGARVTVSYTGDPQNVIEELITDGDGRTETLDLATPPLEYSLEPNVNQPYSEYTVKVEAEGYELVEVTGSELLSGEQSVQQVDLKLAEGAAFADVTIPDHTLFGEYPAKIPESEIKPTRESGEIVLSRVVIPEYIIVHDGAPTDSTARDYYVRYRDYIKNVGVLGNLCNMAGCGDPGEYPRNHVIYAEPCLYRMVPQQGIRFYDHFVDGLRSQMDLRQEYFRQHFPCGR